MVSVLLSSFVYVSFDGFTVIVPLTLQLVLSAESSSFAEDSFAASTVTAQEALAVSVVSLVFFSGSIVFLYS